MAASHSSTKNLSAKKRKLGQLEQQLLDLTLKTMTTYSDVKPITIDDSETVASIKTHEAPSTTASKSTSPPEKPNTHQTRQH